MQFSTALIEMTASKKMQLKVYRCHLDVIASLKERYEMVRRKKARKFHNQHWSRRKLPLRRFARVRRNFFSKNGTRWEMCFYGRNIIVFVQKQAACDERCSITARDSVRRVVPSTSESNFVGCKEGLYNYYLWESFDESLKKLP